MSVSSTATQERTLTVPLGDPGEGLLSIYMHNPACPKTDSPCYFHRGKGPIMIMGSKAYIMTVAHLFTNEPQNYYLMRGKRPLIPFTFVPTEKEKEMDQVLIPIGEFNKETGLLTAKVNCVYHEKIHCHRNQH